jgi:hypothetical protein
MGLAVTSLASCAIGTARPHARMLRCVQLESSNRRVNGHRSSSGPSTKLKPSLSLQSGWYSWLRKAPWELSLQTRRSLIEQPMSASKLSSMWASSCRKILTMLWFSTCAMLNACSDVQRLCQRSTCVLLRLSLKVSLVICRLLMTVWYVPRASCSERQPTCINWKRKGPNSMRRWMQRKSWRFWWRGLT